MVDEGLLGCSIGGVVFSLGVLDLLGLVIGCLLDDGFEGLFEDIDIFMYDNEFWVLVFEGFKLGFEDGLGKEEVLELDEVELDYFMDVLVGI